MLQPEILQVCDITKGLSVLRLSKGLSVFLDKDVVYGQATVETTPKTQYAYHSF